MIYTAITGRRFDLEQLTPAGRSFLAEVEALFRHRPGWDEFSRAWMTLGREALWKQGPVPVGGPVYRICQDLAARLGLVEGRLSPPDYRDRLADLIEERFGSHYQFCKQTGIDQGHLSRVLAGKKHFAAKTLFDVLEALGLEMVVVDRERLPTPPWLETEPLFGQVGDEPSTVAAQSGDDDKSAQGAVSTG